MYTGLNTPLYFYVTIARSKPLIHQIETQSANVDSATAAASYRNCCWYEDHSVLQRMANIFAQIIVKNIANKELAFAITSSVNKHDYSSSGASIDVYKVTNLIGHIERSSSGDKMNSSCNLQFPTRNFVSIYLVNICQMITKAVDFRAIQILN